ncbi:MAG: hypothetical protein L0H75_06805, partial [Nitrosospira sp.]|nr:hypothetical protein [Nitrosospira sp.]
QVGEAIVKLITETATDLGLKLNPAKTKSSGNVVRASIKSDKLAWMARKQTGKSLQKHLLIIHDHAVNFPNAGSLVAALNNYHKRISRVTPCLDRPRPLIAIVVDIAYRNPRSYPICSAILSKLLSFIKSSDEKKCITERIREKFSQIPNTGHMQIWLQRVTFPLNTKIHYDEPICKLVAGDHVVLWNCDWLSSDDLKNAVNARKIVDTRTRDEIAPVIPISEVELFMSKANVDYY